jgi:prepilin signal peptidase PulO-like enzyme (type II secretory pathway)
MEESAYTPRVIFIPLLFVFVLGAVLGSFGNVVVLRGERNESLGGRSYCPACKRQLSWIDLVPVASYVWLRGKCRTCKAPISVQYPLVELLSGVLFVAAFTHQDFDGTSSVALAIALWLLLLIAVQDLRTGLISDALNIPFVIASLTYALLTLVVPWEAVLICGGFLGIQWLVSRGTWVGSGDVILACGIGALARTLPGAATALFAAYILGAVIAAALLLTRKKTLAGSVPFGPFLALGGCIAVFWA